MIGAKVQIFSETAKFFSQFFTIFLFPGALLLSALA
jgi:hypothetical protein